jgi:hypothetical protein
MVIAVPLAAVVQRHQEQIGALQLSQQRRRPVGLEHRVAQRPGQPLQHRGAQQELPDPPWLALEHLGTQVIGHVAVGAVEGGDETARVLAAAKRKAGQVQPGRPALGPLGQPLHVLGRQLQAHRAVQQFGCLFVGELQIAHPQFGQLSSGSHPGQLKRRVGPGGQRHVDAGREVLQEVTEPVMAAGIGDEVIVVQHQYQRRADRAQVVQQRRQDHPIKVRARTAQGLERGGADPGLDGAERLDHIDPEPRRVVVARVQRDPGHPTPAGFSAPLAEQGRLARTGRSVQQTQLGRQAGLEQRPRPGPGDQPRPRRLRLQLGRHQTRTPHADCLTRVMVGAGHVRLRERRL